MLARIIATIGILASMSFLSLANYWYVFGIWPKSWWLYFGIALTQIGLSLTLTAVTKGE